MKRQDIEELIYGKPDQQRRFTQDFPILPDVWIAFGEDPIARRELLLTPHTRSDAPTLATVLRWRLRPELEKLEVRQEKGPDSKDDRPRILFNESVVLARFSFRELMRVAIPLTDWWSKNITPITEPGDANKGWGRQEILELAHKPAGQQKQLNRLADPRMLQKLITIIGSIEIAHRNKDESTESKFDAQAEAFADLLQDVLLPQKNEALLWSVSLNREAKTSLRHSRMTVKADAAARLFEIDTAGIRWAVLDTGVDARHPAFSRRKSDPLDDRGSAPAIADEFESRVVRTYDFLRIKDLLDPDDPDKAAKIEGSAAAQAVPEKLTELLEDLENNLRKGRAIDWDLFEPFLRIPHVENKYKPPIDPHGTHVAGIIAANWKDSASPTEIKGMCPDLELYDLRVLGPGADEFTVMAALQFVRHLNAHKDQMAIHGVNLSMSVPHDVANYACGRTPVCLECERVAANGVVVVAAAGNRGFVKFSAAENGATGDYRYISITDPGNADGVITVGSTHRLMPHNYGVSYFSSRGPTGDGRRKPDLVAPGERIESCGLHGGFETMDGTSMAAPHVSGAAALLIARHPELIGQPTRVKEILCKSATDLGREPRFQGHGMVDVLRALQSV